MKESRFARMGMALTLVVTSACSSVPPRPTETLPAVASTMDEQFPFPEELQQALEYWVFKQDYDHKFLEPLEEYAKHLYETSPIRGWTTIGSNLSIEVWVGESKSPELLQESHAVLFKVNDDLRGFIWNDDGTYSLQGTGEERVEGTLSHFSGEVEGNYNGTFEDQIPIDPYAPFKFLMEWKGPNKWRGWINFRGDEAQRPFGGGKNEDSFPESLKP